MPKYLLHINYIGEGIHGLIKEGGSRRKAAAEAAVKSVGGTLEAMYYAFGDTDCFAIAEAPNHHAVAAAVLTLNSSGRVSIKTTVLLTPEDVDAAVKLSPSYRAPGQ
ncbi:MAG: GYD domain-containing protein [Thermaceae bacterium]|nr:GYD domain-containing protein [Thermaceae bacterium]